MKTQVEFKEWFCSLSMGKYPNGRVSIRLVDVHDGFPVATATVNLPDKILEEGEIIIKDSSENEGMYNALVKADIITIVHRWLTSGYCEYPVCFIKKT